MTEPEWSGTKPEEASNAALAAAAQAKADAGIDRKSAWLLFGWVLLPYLLMTYGAVWGSAALWKILARMNVELPLPAILGHWLTTNSIGLLLIFFALPLTWGLLIHLLPTDRRRRKACLIFCAFSVILPAALLVFHVIPIAAIQRYLESQPPGG